jgi:branched-chain amino acid transport system ATP-binding protein
MPHALVEVRGVSKRYGSLLVADNISLAVDAGEVLGILGPNGAGKTTLFNIMCGDVAPDAGSVHLDGRDVTSLRPYERCRRGIGRSYQIARPFGGLSVFENVLVAALFGGRRSERAANAVCMEVLELTGLRPKANRLAGSLPLLDRKRLEFARALGTGPTVLLLDEIAGGLTDNEAHEVVATIAAIRDRGVAVVWVEHVIHALLAAATRLVVLDAGRKIAEGDPHDVIGSAEVQRVYMGVDVETAAVRGSETNAVGGIKTNAVGGIKTDDTEAGDGEAGV